MRYDHLITMVMVTMAMPQESERCFVEAAIADLREREEELVTSSVGGPPSGGIGLLILQCG